MPVVDNKPAKVTRRVFVGGKPLGGADKTILVQTMLNTPPDDAAAAVRQAKLARDAGCDILRIAIPSKVALHTLSELKAQTDMPVVADIHFDYRLALESLYAGADKIRINPGNIAQPDHVRRIAQECIKRNIPVRIGINTGSIAKKHLANAKNNVEAMLASMREQVEVMEGFGCDNLVLSAKSSDIRETIAIYRRLSEEYTYPLHIGVTEAGPAASGTLKSGIAIGTLLLDGIGDTIRVSLTDSPEKEVKAAFDILAAVGLTNRPEIISCPTCGRTRGPVIETVGRLEALLESKQYKKRVKIAVMGCEVNGPGEAKSADLGMAFAGKEQAVVFKSGEMIDSGTAEAMYALLLAEIEAF